MPRICFIHKKIDDYCRENQTCDATYDVCKSCYRYIRPLDAVETEGLWNLVTMNDLSLITGTGAFGEPVPADAKIALAGNDVPYIDDENYTCDECGIDLTSENYYF